MILTPIAAIIVGATWLGVNLGRGPGTGTPGVAPEMLTGQTLDAVVTAAEKYMREGSHGRALTILAAATEKHPNEQRLLALHARCLLEMGRQAEALAEFERACFVGPDNASFRDFAATLASQAGENERADAHWAVAQKLDPENPKYPLYRAQVQRRLGKSDAARANLVLAISIDPSLAEAWASLAAIALEENRPGMARQYIDRARRLDPANAYFRVIEARALRRAGDAEAAADLLYAIPEPSRLRDKTVLAELALCLGMMELPGRAADLYLAASDAAPEDAEFAYEAALWLDRAGRPEEARVLATRAVSLGSDAAATLLSQPEG